MIYRYPGAQHFTQAYQHLFFGREGDISELFTYLSVAKITVLYGKSGLGKSSLIQAGVLPRLTSEDDLQVILVRFNSYAPHVEEGIVQQFQHHLQTSLEPIAAPAIPENGRPSAWEILKVAQASQSEARGILLVFDQFEEVFSYPDQAELGQVIADLLNDRVPPAYQNPSHTGAMQESFDLHKPLNLSILFSIRSDKLNLLNNWQPFIPYILRNCYELNLLSRRQAKKGIATPASAEGSFLSPPFVIQEEAIEEMLEYLTNHGTQAVEPFQLQILCQYFETQLVIGKGMSVIRVEDLPDLQRVYQDYYLDQISQTQPEDQQESLRKFIEEGLILEEEQRRVSVYGGQIQKEWQVSNSQLSQLVETRLIRVLPMQGGDTPMN